MKDDRGGVGGGVEVSLKPYSRSDFLLVFSSLFVSVEQATPPFPLSVNLMICEGECLCDGLCRYIFVNI